MKKIWIVLLVMGSLTFVIPLGMGIYYAIVGFSGLCFCGMRYGFSAFFDSILLYSYLCWPSYIVGIILIILSILKIKRK